MHDDAPALDDDDRRMERLRVLLAEMRTAQEEEQQQLEQAIEVALPGTVARVQHAVLEPEGDHLSVMQRLRNKIPGWLGKAAEEAVVLTMMGAITALVKMYMSDNPDGLMSDNPDGFMSDNPAPLNSATLVDPRHLNGMLQPMMATPNKSVVDEVFAKAKATNRMRERPRPPTN